jgi:phosphoglycolate phosphatase
MQTPLRYRAVLFDLDGTLVDSYTALAEAVNHARRTEGLHELSAARIREFVGDGVERLLQRAFDRPQVSRHLIDAFETRYDEICCEESKVLSDVEKTLQALADLGVEMAVCTNKPTGFSQKIVEHLDLARYFRAVVGPDLAGARKPDRRHLLYTLDALGAASRDTLFVGDMTVDIEAARNTGIDVAVIASGSSTAEQLERANPDYFLRRFPELIPIVRREAA